MGEKYKIGEYAYMEFHLGKKPRHGDRADYPMSGVYKIIDTDKYNVLIQEEEIELLVQKSKIKKFELINVT
jgi:hypothetical protein